MPSTLILPPEHETGHTTLPVGLPTGLPAALPPAADALPGTAPIQRGGRGTPFTEPQVEKLRGLRLIALWTALTAGAWAVLGGAGYGLYVVVHSLLL